MNVKATMVTVGSMIGSPARATMLAALLDRPALTATELSRRASVSSASASQHLAKLTASGLLVVERHGRHRYYSIASADIAAALSTLERLGAPLPRPPAPRESAAIRQARLCYDHVAGGLGVGITDAMLGNGWLESSGRDYLLTEPGDRFLQGLGVDVDGARAKRRLFARACLDWSERRAHLAGALGAALAARLFELDWLERSGRPREIRVTARGEAEFARLFGMTSAKGVGDH